MNVRYASRMNVEVRTPTFAFHSLGQRLHDGKKRAVFENETTCTTIIRHRHHRAAKRLESNQAYVSRATWRPLEVQTEPAMTEGEKRRGVGTGNSELIEKSKPRVRLFEGCVALRHRNEHCYPLS
jgi:hypothetical protein